MQINIATGGSIINTVYIKVNTIACEITGADWVAENILPTLSSIVFIVFLICSFLRKHSEKYDVDEQMRRDFEEEIAETEEGLEENRK